MKFQLEKLIIWPQRIEFPPKIISFHLGKVNVITGASRTGKSAIIPIIDYCLGSGTCSIPIEIIRNHAQWYGILIRTESEKILFARKVPEGAKVSQECYVLRGKQINIPNEIKEKNQNVDGVKEILNTIANIPYFNRDDEGFNARLSFRDLTHLVFQSQDIIANQSILFYKTHEVEHREKLRNWFPYILGAETLDIIKARNEIKDIDKELSKRRKEFDRAKDLSNEWLYNLLGQLNVAYEYGLYNGDFSLENNIDKLVLIAKGILDNKYEAPKTDVNSLSRFRKEIMKLEEQENALSQEIAVVEKRLKDMNQLENSLSGFQSSTKRKVERLGISTWIKENAKEENDCPICGNIGHPLAKAEILKICKAVEAYESITPAALPIPAEFEREKTDLIRELKELIEKKDDLQKRFDVIRAKDEDAQKYHQRTKDMFLFLGQLKSTVELIERLTGTDGVEDIIKKLEERKQKLEKIISTFNVQKVLDKALDEIGTLILDRLRSLDVDENYKKTVPKFSIRELGIQVYGNDGTLHFLGEVGSASNWVSFHLALICALQEYFISQVNQISPVPSFSIFDQPSQVYFPRVRKETDDDPEYENKDEDEEAVKKMFETIATSVTKMKGKWQVIVLEHARNDIYGDIENVVEVVEWRNGEKLIPEIWYTES